jgi:hypothetical protein
VTLGFYAVHNIRNKEESMSQHLPILQSLFPSKVFLGPEEISLVLNITPKHVYNLSSSGKLGFRLAGITDKVQVSIVELARYLDEKTLTPTEVAEPQPLKKKVGRPRGAVKNQQ